MSVSAVDVSESDGATSGEHLGLLDVLTEDTAPIILSYIGINRISSAATVCRYLQVLCSADPLWQQLVCRTWPLLPVRLRPIPSAPTWQAVARKRATVSNWTRVGAHMDELEHMVCMEANPDLDRFALLMVGVFATSTTPLAHVEGQAWARVLRSALCHPALLEAMERWAAARAAALDDFYEGCGGTASANLARRTLLLQALRAASALKFAHDEVIELQDDDDEEAAAATWKAAGLPRAIDEIASSVASLELEGFNVAIPPHLLPARMPSSHRWWMARPPLHASGRIHYC